MVVLSAIKALEDEYDELLGALHEAEERFGQARGLVEATFADVAAEWRPTLPTDADIDQYNRASDAILEVHRKLQGVVARFKAWR